MPIPLPSGFKSIVASLLAACMLVAPQALAPRAYFGEPPPAENEDLKEARALPGSVSATS